MRKFNVPPYCGVPSESHQLPVVVIVDVVVVAVVRVVEGIVGVTVVVVIVFFVEVEWRLWRRMPKPLVLP